MMSNSVAPPLSPPRPAPFELRDAIAVLLLVAVTFALYWPSLNAGFVSLDDYMYVIDNQAVLNPSVESVRRFFTEVLKPTTIDGYYQPLTMLSLMVDAWLAGGNKLDPFFYHLTNILLHAMAGSLLYVFVRQLFANRTAAAIAALFFLFHPAQVESVAWISQRKSGLATCFAIASLIVYVQYARSGRTALLLACAALMTLGNLAKPIVMPLPFVLILLDIWPLNRRLLGALPEKLIFLPIMAASAYVAWASQSSTAMLGAPKVDSLDKIAGWLGLLSYNLMLYLGNLIWPIFLSPYRTIPRDLSWSNPAIAAALVIALALAFACLLSLRRTKGLLVGAVGFIMLLSPGLGSVHFAATCVGDRFLYLPMVMLLLPIASYIANAQARPPQSPAAGNSRFTTAVGFCVIGLTLCAVLSHRQQAVWNNSRNMWFHIQSVAPDLAKANHNVAIALIDEGKPAEAIGYARKALQVEPEHSSYLLALGRACTLTGRPTEATAYLEKAVKIGLDRRQGYGYIALGEAAMARGDIAAARACVARADQIGWDNPQTIALIAQAAYQFAKNCDAAIEFYQLAVSRAPLDLTLIYSMAECLRLCGRTTEALAEYERFVSLARQQGVDVSQVESAMVRLRDSIAASQPTASAPGR